MANGSFGLSGLPTAPTTVGSAPNNALTPVSAVVNSTAGFQAGDLVYNYAGDIAPVPGNYVSTGTFPITSDNPTQVQNITNGELWPSPVSKAYGYRDISAKLTNGNIVIVYLRNDAGDGNNPFFKIIDENGTVVVTDTMISTIAGGKGMISVCALTGGGFAVAWNSWSVNSYYTYAIYTNTGSVTLAPTTDSTSNPYGGISNWLQAVARPDGSWILAGVTNSTTIAHKVYSATGTQVYAWTSVGAIGSPNYWFQYVVRSDGSFIVFTVNGSNYPQYTVYSSTNTVAKATAQLTATTPNNTNSVGGAIVFSDNTAVFTFTNSSTAYYITISAANVAGSLTAYTGLPAGNLQWAKPTLLANGNYILWFTSSDNSRDAWWSYTLSYAVYNASNVVQQAYQTIGSFATSQTVLPTIVQTTNFIHVLQYNVVRDSGVANGWNANSPFALTYAKVSPTTYAVIKSVSVTQSVGNSAAIPVSGYARVGSTPSAASFFPTSSGTIVSTPAAGTIDVAQTVIDSSGTCTGFDTASLGDGSCLILYRITGGTYPLKLAVISPAGALVSTTTLVASTYTGTAVMANTKLAVLTDGRIAVSYINASNIMQLAILSSTYSVLATVETSFAQVTSDIGCGLCALPNNRFAFVFRNVNQWVYYAIYNSSLTQTVAPSNIYNGGTNNAGISCSSYPGGFLAGWSVSANSYFYAYLGETSPTNFNVSTISQTGDGNRVVGQKLLTGPSNNIYGIGLANATPGTSVRAYAFRGVGAATAQDSSAMSNSNLNTSYAVTFTITPFGDYVAFAWYDSTKINIMVNTPGLGIDYSSGVYTSITSGQVSFPATLGANYMVAGTLAGHKVLLALVNSSNILTYFVVNPANFSYSASVTAGVTPSSTVALNPAKGFSLVGVSSTAAPANGSGTVVINGPAQLNSNYSASTPGQSFNFGNPVTFGAAGTISGRNVNLIGNV